MSATATGGRLTIESVTVVVATVPSGSVAVMVTRYSPGLPVLEVCEASAGGVPVRTPVTGSITIHDGVEAGSSAKVSGSPSGSTTNVETTIGVERLAVVASSHRG